MKLTHPIFDVAGALGVVWLWTAICESFRHAGLWRVINGAAGNVRGMAAEAVVLATCILAGWFVLAAASWIAWRFIEHNAHRADFPVARVHA